ncbi:hypothetical protein Tco_0158335, partial [Tanacetum coccineum]
TEDGNTSSDADTFYLGDEASVKKKEAEVAKRPELNPLRESATAPLAHPSETPLPQNKVDVPLFISSTAPKNIARHQRRGEWWIIRMRKTKPKRLLHVRSTLQPLPSSRQKQRPRGMKRLRKTLRWQITCHTERYKEVQPTRDAIASATMPAATDLFDEMEVVRSSLQRGHAELEADAISDSLEGINAPLNSLRLM